MGPVRIRHDSHEFATQSSHSVDRTGWQAKMASIEIWIPWRNAHKPHSNWLGRREPAKKLTFIKKKKNSSVQKHIQGSNPDFSSKWILCRFSCLASWTKKVFFFFLIDSGRCIVKFRKPVLDRLTLLPFRFLYAHVHVHARTLYCPDIKCFFLSCSLLSPAKTSDDGDARWVSPLDQTVDLFEF